MSALKKGAVTCSVAAVLSAVATLYPNELKTSQAGLELLAGYEDCRLEAYRDSIGIPTIGIGSTSKVCMGDRIDVPEVARRFVKDVKEAEQCVIQKFNGKNMPQAVFDSVTSLVYNVGCTGTSWNSKHKRPTSIAAYAQAKDWHKVCYHLGDFTRAGGKVSQGLVNRRTKEQAHCLKYQSELSSSW